MNHNQDGEGNSSQENSEDIFSTNEAQQQEDFSSASTNPKQVMITDTELRNIQKELMDYKDKYLRLLADGENTRKRMQKERQEMTKYALESIIVDFLKPLDNLENALKFAQNMSDDVKNWAYGFQMILTQFKDVLSENGVQSIDSLGKEFNPHDHEAVETCEATNQPINTIVEEYVRGYKMGDRTIRAARVKVAKPKENKEETQKPQENE